MILNEAASGTRVALVDNPISYPEECWSDGDA
jgi:hypothetical protein